MKPKCPYECVCDECPTEICPECGAKTLVAHYCSACEGYQSVTTEEVEAMTIGELDRMRTAQWGDSSSIDITDEDGSLLVEIRRGAFAIGIGRGDTLASAIADAINDAEPVREARDGT